MASASTSGESQSSVHPEVPSIIVFRELACRIGDEKRIVEKVVSNLFDTLKSNTKPAPYPSNKCITVPKKINCRTFVKGPERTIEGDVWRWQDFRYSEMDLIFQLLQNGSGKNNCFAATQMEICLNPHHYLLNNEVDNPLTPRETWATVAYYERDRRMGPAFDCRSNSVMVGCYGRDHEDIFDLSSFTRADRDWELEECRRLIGDGIWLHSYSGQVFLELASEAPIFVQSPYHNHLRALEETMACRLAPRGCRIMRLMDDSELTELLEMCLRDGLDAVFEVAKMCTIRISFGNPWGSEWGAEDDIRNVPCWVEVRLIRQLKKLEKVLEQLGCPYKLHY